jgi:hypothetical protein
MSAILSIVVEVAVFSGKMMSIIFLTGLVSMLPWLITR